MSGRVAIVTGAGQGLGEEIAVALAQRGYRLALLGRTASKLERVADRIGGDVLTVPVDLSEPDGVRGAFQRVADHFGQLDVLVNNATTYYPFLMADATDAQITGTINGALTGPLFCIREAIRLMQPRGTGDIVSITSESVQFPAPMLLLYAASKAALAKVHEGLRRELSGSGLRTMVLEVGRIDSSSADDNWPGETMAEFGRRWVELGYSGPLSRDPVTAKTLAATVAHMVDSPREAMLELVRMRARD